MYYQLAKHRVMETERLILRPITLEDADDMFEYGQDVETTRFIFPTHTSIEDTKKTIVNLFMKTPLGNFAIELKESGKMIGTCNIRPNVEEDAVEIAYALNKNYWRRGYAPEAAKKLIDFSIHHLNAKRIFAVYDTNNPASGRVMEKLGMTQEMIRRNDRNFRGDFRDLVICSLIP